MTAAGSLGDTTSPAELSKPKQTAFYLLVTLSGLAGLGYQMVWARLLAVSLGHEIVAVLAVVAAFFVGLALGGFLFNRSLQRTPSPQRWYLGLELIIAAWALVLIALIPLYNQWMPQVLGPTPGALTHWGWAFLASLLLLLPATTAMGATLPAMERIMSTLAGRQHRLPGLYAANTLGAVLGTLGATFVLIPQWGLTQTQWLLAAVNLLCALGIGGLFPRSGAAAQAMPVTRPRLLPAGSRPLLLLFCCGLLGIGYEILVVRVLSQILENTVYSFAAVLAVYLLGVAVGSWWYQRRFADTGTPAAGSPAAGSPAAGSPAATDILTRLLVFTACSCVLGLGALWLANAWYLPLLQWIERTLWTALLTELAMAALVFLLPTLCMGALFSHLALLSLPRHGLGKALGWNTLGGALAPALFGVVLLPWLGAKTALLLIPLGYLALVAGAGGKPRPAVRSALIPALAIILLLLAPLPLRFVAIPDQARLLEYREGVMAAAAVVEQADGSRHLKVNNHFTMGGTASRLSDHRQSHLPLLLHGTPRSALYLGLGTGITFEATKFYPELEATGVELIPEAIELMPSFGVNPDSGHWSRPPHIIAADARRFILSSRDRFDVILAEIFHPSRDGAGALYTREHFQAIKQRLQPDGVFCQWLPLFQLDLDTLRIIIRTFLEVFPTTQLHLGHLSLEQPILCLAGFQQPPAFTSPWLLPRVRHPALQQELVQTRLNSDFALFGGYLGDAGALARFAGEGPLNTDDRPLVTYQALDFVYRPQEPAAERLLQLVTALASERNGQPLSPASFAPEHFAGRLQRYWEARDRFIATGVANREATDLQQMLLASKEDLLAMVRRSDDFAPAYRTLLLGARSLAASDPRAAYRLLTELQQASPQQPGAKRLKQQLFGAGP